MKALAALPPLRPPPDISLRLPEGPRAAEETTLQPRLDRAGPLTVDAFDDVATPTWQQQAPAAAATTATAAAATLSVDPEASAAHAPFYEDGVGEAVAAGRSHGLLRLMELGHSAADADADGQPPLHVAARHGRAECAKILIANGAQVSARTRDGLQETALHVAARCGHPAVALLLTQHGGRLQERDARGDSALHAAVAARQAAVLTALLNSTLNASGLGRAGALHCRNALGESALGLAARLGGRDCAAALLEAKAHVDGDGARGGRKPLHAALLGGQLQAATFLLEQGARLHADAAATGVAAEATEAEVLGRRGGGGEGGEGGEGEPHALHVAVASVVPVAAVPLLLGARADPTRPDARGRTALHAAVLSANGGAAEALLGGSGAEAARRLWLSPDAAGELPLQLALRLRRAAVLRSLLAAARGANLPLPLLEYKTRGVRGGSSVMVGYAASPLALAVSLDAAEETQLLLEAKADPLQALDSPAHAAGAAGGPYLGFGGGGGGGGEGGGGGAGGLPSALLLATAAQHLLSLRQMLLVLPTHPPRGAYADGNVFADGATPPPPGAVPAALAAALRAAAVAGAPRSARFLAQHSAAACGWLGEDCGTTALHLASQPPTPPAAACSTEARLGCLQAMLRAGADAAALDARGETALHALARTEAAAAAAGGGVAAALLGAAPQLLQRRGPDGDTPLLTAVRCGARGAAGALVALGAQPAEHDAGGEGAWHLAARADDAEMIDALLGPEMSSQGTASTRAHALSVDLRSAAGDSPLMTAAAAGAARALRALLRCGAAPDATRAADGWTALHVAAAAGHGGECARTLLEAGARLVPDDMGRLPDECAATLGAPPPNRDAPQKSKP